jgi:small conductance mechanosensitive channel
MEVDTTELQTWFSQNILLILIIGGLLVVAYLYSGRAVHTLVRQVLTPSQDDFSDHGVQAAELDKRAATIEALLTTIIRLSIISLGVFLVVGLTGTWNILVVIGLFLAAVTVAGQAIVMDYIMGIFIIVEGTFFKGDNIELGSPPWKGDVEDVGLRRTRIRAVDGTVYSVSNAELRVVANRTRIYAAAEVKVRGIRQGDLGRVAAIMERIAAELAEDPAFKASILDAHTIRFVDDADELGGVAVLRGRVVAGDRWKIASELRFRLDAAFAAEGIELNRQALTESALGQREA